MDPIGENESLIVSSIDSKDTRKTQDFDSDLFWGIVNGALHVFSESLYLSCTCMDFLRNELA